MDCTRLRSTSNRMDAGCGSSTPPISMVLLVAMARSAGLRSRRRCWRRPHRRRCCALLPNTSRGWRKLLMERAKKIMEATTDPLDAMLARLQLSGIRDQLDSLLDEAARANLSSRETLILLCERDRRQGPSPHRDGAEARTLLGGEGACWLRLRGAAVNRSKADPCLAASRWIANGENVLLLPARRR